MALPEGIKREWAYGVMWQPPSSPESSSDCLFAWLAPAGHGTPLLWSQEASITWAYLGTTDPHPPVTNGDSAQWVRTLMEEPSRASEWFSGVFAFFAHDSQTGRTLIMHDRLGIQPIYWTHTPAGGRLFSTHPMWLLLESGHDGSVDHSGFFQHMAFGYTVEPGLSVYSDVRKLPPAGYALIERKELVTETYWSMPDPSKPADEATIEKAAAALHSAMTSASAVDGPYIGLTAGKDSLCLASVLPSEERPLSGTFGAEGSADRLQAEQLAEQLGWPYESASLCSSKEFSDQAFHIAFHSAGLTTAAYVDMTWFAANLIPPGRAFVMGEGGECIRDFFGAKANTATEALVNQYMTSQEVLQATLSPRLAQQWKAYPDSLVDHLKREVNAFDDEIFALEFYRRYRMPGNFSLRHSVMGTIRPRISPFLDNRFIDTMYAVEKESYRNSELHRRIIARARPELLEFFEAPSHSVSTQEWANRFSHHLGDVIAAWFGKTLSSCRDTLNPQGVELMCRNTIAEPSRAMFHLLRLLPFSLARHLIRHRPRQLLADIRRNSKPLA